MRPVDSRLHNFRERVAQLYKLVALAGFFGVTTRFLRAISSLIRRDIERWKFAKSDLRR